MKCTMTTINRYTKNVTDAFVRAGYWSPELTVDFWSRNSQSRPNALAVVDERVAYTWAEGARAINAIASGLIAAGVPRDGVLLVQAPNSALHVLFRLACEKAGVIPAILHLGFRRSEIEAVARKVNPIGAVIATETKRLRMER